MKNPAAGGGRWVDVQPSRFPAWIDEFHRRHGDAGHPATDATGAVVAVRAADGAVAECHPPFPPVGDGRTTGDTWPETMAAHALADRTVGVLLARLGGYAVGVFTGSPPRLVAAKTGSRPVHGRSAAGGWSQHRFARRREKQASEALRATADAAAAIFAGPRLDAVVLGGDRRAIAGLADDPRLKEYLTGATDRFLTVPDPKLAVLRETPRAFLAIRVRLIDPAEIDPAETDPPETESPGHARTT
jgi:Actinobacteria/chloroflexi VLRF1 release factor